MLDGIEYEKNGVPTAVLCTDAFRDVSGSVTGIHGLPHYEVLYVPHPISAKADSLLHAAADEVYASVVHWLTTGAK